MIGIILIRMDLNAPLKVGFCVYTSTLNATSTVGESQGKGGFWRFDSQSLEVWGLTYTRTAHSLICIVPIIPSICATQETIISFPSV